MSFEPWRCNIELASSKVGSVHQFIDSLRRRLDPLKGTIVCNQAGQQWQLKITAPVSAWEEGVKIVREEMAIVLRNEHIVLLHDVDNATSPREMAI